MGLKGKVYWHAEVKGQSFHAEGDFETERDAERFVDEVMKKFYSAAYGCIRKGGV